MHFENYSIEDFAANDDFISWCLAPDKDLDLFWNNILLKYPHQKESIFQAKELVITIYTIEKEKNEPNFEMEIWDKIEQDIFLQSETHQPQNTNKTIFTLLGTAASILIIFGLWQIIDSNKSEFLQKTDLNWVTFENDTNISKRVHLADNSTVTIEPFSSLKYPTAFAQEQRIVLLKGEAFFDIEKDPNKPFLVYANETITKVLGTSFRITAFEGQEQVEVDVKSGKVAVYAKVKSDKKSNKKQVLVETDTKIYIPQPNKKLEVTPNQKVVFNRKSKKMVKAVTELPQIIAQVETLPQFQFENEAIVNIFKTLETAYGINIDYDEEKLKDCTITTKLEKGSLFNKLNIICTALNLKFKEKDANIFIEGKGC